MTHSTLRASLLSLSAYRCILDEPLMQTALNLLTRINNKQAEESIATYHQLFFQLHESGFAGLGDWIWDYLRYETSPYAKLAARGETDAVLTAAAERDVSALIALATMDDYAALLKRCQPDDAFEAILESLPMWNCTAPFDFASLTAFYRANGAGIYAKYRTFLWENDTLIPVADPDCPRPEELLGYERQRDQVLANTRIMLEGNQANNVLLFGDGGTGKSATVKSMLHRSGFEDLRLVEIAKEGLISLPVLIRNLGGLRQKFILFIDDLAFDKDDKVFSSLKTILEGGLERRPANVVIYATSNRRHLVKQTISDRAGDEMDTFETIAEKTALAERFGLRIPYLTMSKAEYLALVSHLAQRAEIKKDEELLHAQAMTWEIRHGGRTPRTAQQFIASLHM